MDLDVVAKNSVVQQVLKAANFDDDTVSKLPSDIDNGVYYGWAQLLRKDTKSDIYKMVTSVGRNPFYHEKKKTLETHVMYNFPSDFYGETLKIVLLGEIRQMTTFNNVEELVAAIQNDIAIAEHELDSDVCQQYINHPYFRSDSVL